MKDIPSLNQNTILKLPLPATIVSIASVTDAITLLVDVRMLGATYQLNL